MNENKIERRRQKDSAKVKKNINTLMEDGGPRVSKGLEKLTGEAKESWQYSRYCKERNWPGIKQYNAKVNEFATSVSGDLGKKVSQYPWVAISIGLAIGLLLGGLFKRPSDPDSQNLKKENHK